MFQITTATKKIVNLKKRTRVVSGGTGASKTISILLWLIDYCQSHENKIVSVVSESMPHLKRGVIRDFLTIMRAHNYFKEDKWNKTDSTYSFETKTILEFFSADNAGKVHGARRDVLFLNECNNVSFEIFTQLDIRTRKMVFLDFNPVTEFWYYTDLKPNIEHDFLILTYKDNESLSDNEVQAIESRKYNKNWWRIYGEGQLGVAEGRIYQDWQILDDIPHEARLERRGLDFGYSNDPTALVDIYYYNNSLVLDERLYQKGLSNKNIADFILNLEQPSTLVRADSAEPKSIDELKSYGINVLPCTKGKGSVLQGIQYLQDQRVSITKRSVNLIREYRNYCWMTDKNGKTLNQPQDFLNHCLDATRYGAEDFYRKPRQERFDQQRSMYYKLTGTKVSRSGIINL